MDDRKYRVIEIDGHSLPVRYATADFEGHRHVIVYWYAWPNSRRVISDGCLMLRISVEVKDSDSGALESAAPPQSVSVLAGITRDTVIRLAHAMGFELREQVLSRESMYTADELFLTGTAAEITPVASVDDLDIGSGGRGPVTKRIQDAFFGLFTGETEDHFGWLEPIEAKARKGRKSAHG